MYTKSLGLALTLAIALITLGYANPSFAAPKKCDVPDPSEIKGCGGSGDDGGGGFPSGLTVQLIGGEFVSDDGGEPPTEPAVPVTPEAFDILRGVGNIHMTRPGGVDVPSGGACAGLPETEALLCNSWTSVFYLCGDLLIGEDGNGVPEFTVLGGGKSAGPGKAWSVGTGPDNVILYIGFEFVPHPSISTEPLHVGMQLRGTCLVNSDTPDTPVCEPIPESQSLIPASGQLLEFRLDRYSIHVKGKGGVAHNALCHAGSGNLLVDGSNYGYTRLLITAP